MIRLRDVYLANGEPTDEALAFLYRLLSQRPLEANISHRGMPPLEQHVRFVRSRPYRLWYIVCGEEFTMLGSIYASGANEVGIFIDRLHQRHGFAEAAIKQFMIEHEPLPVGRGSWLANVAPRNYQSKSLFEKLGGRIVQLTYELPRGDDGKS